MAHPSPPPDRAARTPAAPAMPSRRSPLLDGLSLSLALARWGPLVLCFALHVAVLRVVRLLVEVDGAQGHREAIGVALSQVAHEQLGVDREGADGIVLQD